MATPPTPPTPTAAPTPAPTLAPVPTPPPALALRPFRPGDRALLRSWVTTEAELVTWAGNAFRWPLDDAQLDAYAAEPGRHIWTAVPAGGAENPGESGASPLGHVSLGGTRLGRVLIAPGARGRGLGEALLTLVIERAFGELALPGIGLGVWAHNTAALRLYEKLGFRTEEVLVDVEEVDGVPWTAVQMRLDAPER